jgi:nucleoside-diphosphate-sugar epimerase
MRVFLTGGTGYIGQALTKTMLARGWIVTALVRNPNTPQARALSTKGAQLATGDVTDRESMRAAMSGADLVVHSAGHWDYGVDQAGKARMQKTNVTGTDNVLGLALELGIPRTVYVSTVQVFGDSGTQPRDETFTRQAPCRTTYEKTKTAAHELARGYQHKGLPLVIVCPHAVIGANDHGIWGYVLRLYLNHAMPLVSWSPNAVQSAVYMDDLTEGVALAAEKGRIGETYLLCGEARTMREHFGYWRQRPGANIPSVWAPPWLMALSFTPLEPLLRLLGLPAFLSRESVAGGATNWYYVSDKAVRELGWTYRSAEAMWLAALDAEIALRPKRTGQSLLQRLKPLDTID